MSRNGERRPVSAGTKVMLVMLAVVIAGSALVLGRLSSGASVDLSKLNRNLLDLGRAGKDDGGDALPSPGAQADAQSTVFPEKAEKKDAVDVAPTKEPLKSGDAETGEGSAAEGAEAAGGTEAASAAAAEPADAEPRSYTLTAAGVLCLEGEVRKNSWNSESKAYDYADMLMLLRNVASGDVKTVFLENLLMDSEKYNDIIAPEYAADLLREGGFTMAACGYAQSWSKGQEGIGATRTALEERGIRPIGIRNEDDQGMLDIVTVNGIRTAFLQYTDTVAARTRKNMEKDGAMMTVPAADAGLISREIEAARSGGAEAVVVMINWGKTGKNQKALAQAAARAGADLIIGAGSRTPEGAEYLDGADGGKVLCAWNLGSLLTGGRENVKRMSGYMLHVEIRSNGRGGVDVLAPEYTPVYAWKYKQDGRFYYRSLAANRPAPDGMNGDQQKTMQKARTNIEETLANSPLTLREAE